MNKLIKIILSIVTISTITSFLTLAYGDGGENGGGGGRSGSVAKMLGFSDRDMLRLSGGGESGGLGGVAKMLNPYSIGEEGMEDSSYRSLLDRFNSRSGGSLRLVPTVAHEIKTIPSTSTDTNHPFFQGVLKVRVMAIGGETTGYAIITKDNEYFELVLPDDLRGKIDHLDGLYVEVQGEIVELQGIETGLRKAIKVEYFSVLE